MDPNFVAYLQGRGLSFNPYSAGNKQYPQGAPNVGPTNKSESYYLRDRLARLKRNALLRRTQASNDGNYLSADWLSPQNGRW